MFLDIRVTLATFLTAAGLALVMFAVGTRAWIAHDRPLLASPRIEARAPVTPDPLERPLSLTSTNTRGVAAPASAGVPNFLAAPRAEPVNATERASARETPAPSNTVMPGAGAVVQERFDVLHEPSGQIVPPRTATAGVGGPFVPLPRPRSTEPQTTAVSVAAQEATEATRPKPTASAAKRAEARKRQQPQRSSQQQSFGGFFSR
jgi:hypothetical protein